LEHPITVEGKTNNCTAIAFDLRKTATTYYFDNISLVKVEVGGGPGGKWEEVVTITPKTPEQKTEIVVSELERWIGGMMDAAGNSVKDWVVVNEPMDDDNPTQVRKAPASPGANDFYWQDYLRGKDYGRTVVGFTRMYGGSGLKLFVNETGLINKDKCEGLINMIEYWEQDGTTKIDGIGAQLSLTCSLDPPTQTQNRANVEEILTLLAETGKLIRISAIDMRIASASGALIPAAEITTEHQKAMSKYYNFVVTKYLEIIPAAQRYGITIQPFESSSNAGLWDGNNSRKFTYSGFADGLAGDNVKHD
jgi:GH35 family endo-1,4-beta-xylanase